MAQTLVLLVLLIVLTHVIGWTATTPTPAACENLLGAWRANRTAHHPLQPAVTEQQISIVIMNWLRPDNVRLNVLVLQQLKQLPHASTAVQVRVILQEMVEYPEASKRPRAGLACWQG